jgi:hypothetical protein
MKMAGFTETLKNINKAMACKNVSGVFMPIKIRKIMNNDHFESHI